MNFLMETLFAANKYFNDHGVEYDIEVNTSRKSPADLAKEIINGMKATPRAFSSLVGR